MHYKQGNTKCVFWQKICTSYLNKLKSTFWPKIYIVPNIALILEKKLWSPSGGIISKLGFKMQIK